MLLKKFFIGAGIALGLGVFIGTLTNCAAYAVQSGPVYSDDDDDDYVYYPDYGVYYGGRHHRYVYMDANNNWRRDNSPNVSVDVLAKSQSVPMNFHDRPEHHHADVRAQYPGHFHTDGQH